METGLTLTGDMVLVLVVLTATIGLFVSELVRVDIAAAGWYPLDLLYFEKRNTSTLQFYWAQEAAGESLRLVPPDAFAHIR